MPARQRGDGITSLRTDIQGLRAIAVTLVVVYHLLPSRLTGGFVGVDVFFVISGFLITAHLLAHPPATPRALATFWSRRVRRLLPASFLVLLCTLVATRLVAPQTQWSGTASQVRGAALYVVNWLLARDSVDYLAAENAASPVQHFWSLSVEEQFYFVWPILIAVLVLLAKLTRLRLLPVVTVGLTLLVGASLAYSIVYTHDNPPAAYFVTPTRMWELGVGGLLALATAPRVLGRDDEPLTPPRPVAIALGWLGLALVFWSAVVYTGQTPFPGAAALAPVLGSAMVIAAHARARDAGTPGGLLALAPLQWLGDVSYSVYLWHWPLVVLVPYLTHHPLDTSDRLMIVAVTLTLAAGTKALVEDRFRAPGWGRPLVKPYALGVVGMAVVVGLATLQIGEVRQIVTRDHDRLVAALKSPTACFGAAALDAGKHCAATPFSSVVPGPIAAALDKSNAYGVVSHRADCWSYLPSFPVKRCTFGAEHSRTTIALVGNSHAGQWLPALEALAKKHHWRITTYLASQCAFGDLDQTFATDAGSARCRSWVRRTTARVAADHPDLVLMTNRVSVPAAGRTRETSQQDYEAGYAWVLRRFHRAQLKVLTLHDTPAPGFSVPDCVAEWRTHYSHCDGSRRDWVTTDPVRAAVRDIGDPDIVFADLNDHVCTDTTCHAVTGGVITYFDATHLTATFAATLAPYLDGPITDLLEK